MPSGRSHAPLRRNPVGGGNKTRDAGHVASAAMLGTDTGMHAFCLATTYPTLASDEGPLFGKRGIAMITPSELLRRLSDLVRSN